MSIHAKFDSGRAVNDIRTTQLPAPGFTGTPTAYWMDYPIPVADTMNTLATGLTVRFDEGGVTTWERSGSNFTGTP